MPSANPKMGEKPIQSQPSRWDALGPSLSARRRHYAATNKDKFNTSYEGRRLSENQHQREPQSLRPGGRRRAANDVRNIPTETTVEEEKVRAALKRLHIDIASVLALENIDDKTREKSGEKVQRCVCQSIQQLSSSLFEVSDPNPSYFLDPSHLHELNSTNTFPDISNAVIWDSGYSLLRHMQSISKSKQSREKCEFLHMISSVVCVCLNSVIHNQQHSQRDQSTRTKSITDLRLCECASILLNVVGCLGCNPTNTDEIGCKASLFSCLAKILAISTMNNHTSHPFPQKRERRGALLPWGAEKTANLITKQSVLPFIEFLATTDDTVMSISLKVNNCCGAIECLYLLLKGPNWEPSFEIIDQTPTSNPQLSKHAAAILSPLVLDVLPDGKENQRVNPLRSRTLSAVSSFWEWSYELLENGKQTPTNSIDQGMNAVISCQCMAAALSAVRAIKTGKAQSNQSANTSEIDVPSVARQLLSLILNEELQRYRRKFFNLLTLLFLAYPTASTSQWHLFLEKSRVKVSPLLAILDEGASVISTEHYEHQCWTHLPSAILFTSTLLTSMPFTVMISGKARPSMRRSEGDFLSRVRNSLLNVFEHTLNLMKAIKSKISCRWLSNKHTSSYAQSMEGVMMQISHVAGKLCTLAGKLCTIVPFDALLQPATSLVQLSGDIYVQSTNIIASTPSITELELEQTLLYKATSMFSNVITETLGADSPGTVRVSTCSAPAEKWLSDALSNDFIGLLLAFPSSKDRIELLSLVAKRSPWTLAREPFNLASFCEVCAFQCRHHNPDSRILGVELLSSFILGRKIFYGDCISHSMVISVVPEKMCPLLSAALEDHSPSVRVCAVSSFGSLLERDWVDLFLSGVDSVNEQPHIDRILNLCSANEKDANVRSSSCKAIGDICTECISGASQEKDDNHNNFPFSDDFVLSFVCKICKVMKNAVSDEKASVRSMALHAIGNAALALKERYTKRSASRFSSSSSVPSGEQENGFKIEVLFPLVCQCLGDKDEKVVANSIRSISHIAYFVYHPENVLEREKDNSAPLDIYKQLLSKLSLKIQFAIEDAAGEMTMELTWKQRNSAKKHAWGACTTLGILLSFSHLLPHINDSLVGSALSSLFRCVQLSSTIHEKIHAAAVKALVKLPITLWHHLACKCDAIGRGLATCFGFLNRTNPQTLYHDDVENLANLLLVAAKKTDFCHLFLIFESVSFSIEFFYQWLVSHDIKVDVLKEITDSISSKKVEQILDVSVVQMFMSRTIQQQQRQGLPCKANVTSLPSDYEEEDEL